MHVATKKLLYGQACSGQVSCDWTTEPLIGPVPCCTAFRVHTTPATTSYSKTLKNLKQFKAYLETLQKYTQSAFEIIYSAIVFQYKINVIRKQRDTYCMYHIMCDLCYIKQIHIIVKKNKKQKREKTMKNEILPTFEREGTLPSAERSIVSLHKALMRWQKHSCASDSIPYGEPRWTCTTQKYN